MVVAPRVWGQDPPTGLYSKRACGKDQVEVAFNVMGNTFKLPQLSRKLVMLCERIAVAALIILAIKFYTQAVVIGLAAGAFLVFTGKARACEAHEIFERIIKGDAGPQLGIALASYFVTPFVIAPAAGLIGAMSMTE